MGFSFNDDKLFVFFETTICPNLIVLNLLVHNPLKNYDFLEFFVVKIDLHILPVDYISKYDLPTLYESKRLRI
jgi:hypothetical protein